MKYSKKKNTARSLHEIIIIIEVKLLFIRKKIETHSFFLLQNFSKNVKIQTTNINNKSRRSVFRPRHSSSDSS